MAMLYVIHMLLFTTNPNHSVDPNITDLTDFLKLFDEFQWGVFACEEKYKMLQQTVSAKSRKEKFEAFNKGKIDKVVPYLLVGLAQAFQVWILEVWSAHRKFYMRKDKSVLPHLSRRITSKNPTFKEASDIFNSFNVPEAALVVEPIEEACRWYKSLKDYINGAAIDLEALFENYKEIEEEQ